MRQGYELEVTPKFELIDESDAYGMSVIDAIQRGADVFVQWNSREYKAGPIAAVWGSLTGTAGQLATTAAPIGRLASDMSQALVLTSTANTPAASVPATLTATKALVANGWSTKLLFDSRLREVPMRMQFYPYTSGGGVVWFTQT